MYFALSVVRTISGTVRRVTGIHPDRNLNRNPNRSFSRRTEIKIKNSFQNEDSQHLYFDLPGVQPEGLPDGSRRSKRSEDLRGASGEISHPEGVPEGFRMSSI